MGSPHHSLEVHVLPGEASLLVVMNFWEELAGMYNRKLVDQTIIYEYFSEVVHDFGNDRNRSQAPTRRG